MGRTICLRYPWSTVAVRVAVSGATGFLGRHVLRALASCNCIDIVALARTPPATGTLPSCVKFVVHDIVASPNNLFALLGEPDVLIHLAWGGLPNYRSLHHFEHEMPLSYSFIKSLVQQGLQQVLVSGTCYEYGIRNGIMQEDDVPHPSNAYALAKNMLRQQLECLQAIQHFGLTWARLFYMFGDGQAASFPMSPGDQIRDYMSVTDVAEKLVTLILHHPGIGIVNVCSGQPVSVKEQVVRFMKALNFDMRLELGVFPYPDYEPMAFWGSAAKWQELTRTRTTSNTNEH
jgi:nucleoside-diphosphate-sugar epimerase